MEFKNNTSYLFTRVKSQKQLAVEIARQSLHLLESYIETTIQMELVQINIFNVTEFAIEFSEFKDKYSQWMSKTDFEQLYLYYDIIGECVIIPYGNSQICEKPCESY